MSLSHIPDIDDTQENSTTNEIRVTDSNISSFHSFSNFPTLNSFSEIKEDMPIMRISSMDRIRMNLKNKLSISVPFDGISKSTQSSRKDSHTATSLADELDEFVISPQREEFINVLKQRQLIPAESLKKREHIQLLNNIGELIRKELVQNNALEPQCGTIFFSFGGFWNIFEKKSTLGQGCSGVVNKCCRRSNPSQEYAVKVVSTNGDEELILKTIQEYKNYRRLNHKNIVNAYELHIDLLTKKTYLLMELAKGRELQSHLASRARFDEKTASRIIREVLCGIQYLHSQGVVHRDIKLENIIVSEDYKEVKIADLNVSKFFNKKQGEYFPDRRHNYQMWTYTGTVAFLPPEVFLDLEYTESIDIWGVGVVLYTMLSGKLPFRSEYQDDLIDKIKKAEVKFQGVIWDGVSSEAKKLITCLLEKDVNKRYTIVEALAHPWLNMSRGRKAPVNSSTTTPIISKSQLPISKNTSKLQQLLDQWLIPRKTISL